MHAVLKWSLLIIFFIIIVVSTVLVYRSIRKFKLKNNPIKFKASLFGITDDYGSKFYIVLSYKNPDLFEPSGTTVLKPLFYLLDLNSTQIKNPTPDELINQYYLNVDSNGNKIAPIIDLIGTNYNEPGALVVGTIDKPSIGEIKLLLDPNKFKPIQGQQYRLGIAIQKNIISATGNQLLPNVYSDFTYVVITAKDPDQPPPVENLSSTNISYNNIYS